MPLPPTTSLTRRRHPLCVRVRLGTPEFAEFQHAAEDKLVVKCLDDKTVPKFNAHLYTQNKTQVGRVDEIFGPVNDVVSIVHSAH